MRLKLQRSRVRRERRVSAVILSHTHTQSYQPVWSFEVRQDDITDCEAVGHMITTVTCLKALSEHCLVWLSPRGGSWCPPNRKEPLPLKTSPWIHSPHTPCYHVQHVQINMFTAPLQPASSIMFHLFVLMKRRHIVLVSLWLSTFRSVIITDLCVTWRWCMVCGSYVRETNEWWFPWDMHVWWLLDGASREWTTILDLMLSRENRHGNFL